MKNLQRAPFPGSSEMAERMRALDWSSTDLGPPSAWPESLRIALGICLSSRFPILLWWGARYNILYNDACIPFLGVSNHPGMLARPGRECWGEIWETIRPMMDGVRESACPA